MKMMNNITYSTLAAFAVTCFGLSPIAQAVNPPPDGGYPTLNTAEGQNALFSLTTGAANTAVGWFSLFSDTDGSFNTATGAGSLLSNTANENTAFGAAALLLNTTGEFNTALGATALLNNTTGGDNTATGHSALSSNTIGFDNTANGSLALLNNTTGARNTAYGFEALFNNTTAEGNTAVGSGVLVSNTTGSSGTAVGRRALVNNTTGSNNIAVGSGAGQNLVTGDNNIDIGNDGVGDEANTIRIGNPAVQTATFVAGISGQTASGGAAVFVNTDGKLGTLTSSARFKTDIRPMDKTSEAILSLKPVTFRYKNEVDSQCIPQFGLVAEDVEKVNTDLVVRDAEGKVHTVRYEAVNAMLLNEFLKEHRKVEKQETTISQLRSTVAQQQKDFQATIAELNRRLDEQASQIQKVSAQFEVSRATPQTVVNNQR